MKYALLLIALLLSLGASAQKIHFTDTTNHWSEVQVSQTGPNEIQFWYSTYGYIGDSIFNNIKYRWFSFDVSQCFGCGSFVREDTVNNKIYVRDVDHDSDALLMDYNLSIGDTFRTGFILDTFAICIVTGIDTTIIENIPYRVWHFSHANNYAPSFADVIEGIGCIQDPVYIPSMRMPIEGWDYMYCFSNKGNTPPLSPPIGWFDNNTSCSQYSDLKTNNPQIPQKTAKIYPNPATDNLNIISGNTIGTVSICNTLGQTIFSDTYTTQTTTINTTSFPKGIYFIHINQHPIQKFIKE